MGKNGVGGDFGELWREKKGKGGDSSHTSGKGKLFHLRALLGRDWEG